MERLRALDLAEDDDFIAAARQVLAEMDSGAKPGLSRDEFLEAYSNG